jgi:hypothetical protein
MTQVSTQPRSAAEHYRESERLIRVAESSGEEIAAAAVLLALVHAVLSTAPRRARRRLHAGKGLTPATGRE